MSYKIYFIYKFQNKNLIEKALKTIEEYNCNKTKYDEFIECFYFEVSNSKILGSDGFYYEDNWKSKASEKIKESNLVCFFMNSFENIDNYINVKWEFDEAKSYNKDILMITDEKPLTKEALQSFFSTNCYGKAKDLRKKYDAEDLIKGAKWNVRHNLLIEDSNDIENKNKELYYKLLIEQYKIMIDTSEKLMDRRQNVSNLYTTICAALVALIGSSIALDSSKGTATIFLCIGLIIIILSITWIIQLNAFGNNNAGKYEVINTIEAKLPANMFDSEYIYNKKNGIKSYSKRETLLPFCFIFLAVCFIIASFYFFFK